MGIGGVKKYLLQIGIFILASTATTAGAKADIDIKVSASVSANCRASIADSRYHDDKTTTDVDVVCNVKHYVMRPVGSKASVFIDSDGGKTVTEIIEDGRAIAVTLHKPGFQQIRIVSKGRTPLHDFTIETDG